MRAYELASPKAAELYFNDSLVGHVASLLAEALGSARRGAGATHGSTPSGSATPRPAGNAAKRRAAERARKTAAARGSWLDRLDAWFWRQEQRRREAWLAQSPDVFELERRIQALARGAGARYY